MEDDEGSTPLDLLARAPLFEVATSDRTGPTLAGLGVDLEWIAPEGGESSW